MIRRFIIVSIVEDHSAADTHRPFRGIELKGEKIYDLKKGSFSTLFKLFIAGLGVLIEKKVSYRVSHK